MKGKVILMNRCVYPYLVYVSAYKRIRFGRIEYVNEYWRRFPNVSAR